MSETVKAAVMRAVLRLLEPLVRLLLEAGIGVGEFQQARENGVLPVRPEMPSRRRLPMSRESRS